MSGALGNLGGVIGGNLAAGFGGPLESIAQSSLTSFAGIGFRPTTGMLQSLPDIAPDWMWTADIVNVAGLSGLSNMYVLELQFQQNSMDTESRYRNGINQTFPRHAQANHCTLQFYEPLNYNISDYLGNWMNLIRDPVTGLYGLPSQYMGSIIITLFDTVGLPQLAMRLDGVWPISIHSHSLQYAQSGRFMTGCDFSINDCIITYSSAGFAASLTSGALNFLGSAFDDVAGSVIGNVDGVTDTFTGDGTGGFY